MASKDDDGLQSFDLMSLSGVLRVCETEIVLLGDQAPRAAVAAKVHDEALFCSLSSGFSFRGRFMLPLDWCLFGYIHRTRPQSWCHGIPLTGGMAVMVPPEGISEFVLTIDSCMTLMAVPLQRVRRQFAMLDPHGDELPMPRLALFHAGVEHEDAPLRRYYERLRRRMVEHEELDADEVDTLLREHLRAGLAAGPSERPACSRGRRTHYLILQRAENFMRSNLRRDIYLNEVCDAAGVSERALRYVYDELLGTSPNRYLSMLRLCTACRNLARADASRRSVKSIALSCGLWDLSRFADNYRRVFGELPRETLMRAPPMDALSG